MRDLRDLISSVRGRGLRLLPLFLLIVLVLIAGCSGLGAVVQNPKVDVVGAELTGADRDAADLLFHIDVDNPNAVGLVLAGVGYKLTLNGQPLLDGRQDQRTQIGARGLSRVDLPVTIRYEDAIRAIRSLRDIGTPTYELQAEFQFAVPLLGTVNVPVTHRGEISLERWLLRLGR
jgi:LEA14-like dessication related protein